MISVQEALDRILSAIKQLDHEEVPLAESYGRYLAADISAKRPNPPFAMSAMDGYAIRAKDASSLPATLKIVGENAAGAEKQSSIDEGEAIRIFTGGPIPLNADCVVIQENCIRDGNHVIVKEGKVQIGQFIRPAGLDFQTNDTGLKKGKNINARDIALMAAMNCACVPVTRHPAIAILSTGNELVEPGDNPSEFQIINSNSYSLAAFVKACGGKAYPLGIAKDNIDNIRAKLSRAKGADLLITIGGASVGDHDLVQRVLKDEGLDLDFWKIAMRPGKPLLFGRWGEMPVLGLPGNPVSVLVTAIIFLKPAIEKMVGRSNEQIVTSHEYARLVTELPANDGRQDYLRASLSLSDSGMRLVHPFAKQDSSMIAPLAKADCLVIRPPFAPAAMPGQDIEILTFPPGF